MRGFPFGKNNYSINLLEKHDSAHLPELHAQAFSHVWDETTFVNFFNDPQVFGYCLRLVGKPKRILAFVLCRLVLDEAEIITIAVHQNFRARGFGRALIDAVMRHLHHERAASLFLEVDESNMSALRLYKRFGFEEVGRRAHYYQTVNGRNDALIMQRKL